MPKPLSIDLRSRVLSAVDAGLSCRQSAERFGVSASSAIRWAALRRTAGDARPKPQGGDRLSHKTEAHADLIHAALDEVPDITQVKVRPSIGLTFESIDAVRNVLTPKRLGLLKAIRESRPKSVYALAKATGRQLKNTQDDVAMLARLDLVELKRGHGKRAALTPRVRYDSIRLTIPLHDAR